MTRRLANDLGSSSTKVPPTTWTAGRAAARTPSIDKRRLDPPGVVVAAGAGDAPAALLGSGLDVGEAQLSNGTGAQVVAALHDAPPGVDGVTFRAYLTGERTPILDAHARGAWSGLALHHGSDGLPRAV